MRARKKRDRSPWLIVGPDPHFASCLRCGGHEPPPPLPMRISAAVAYMDYLVEKHGDCPPFPPPDASA